MFKFMLVSLVSSSVFALPVQIVCHNETQSTSYRAIAIESLMSSDNVMFSRMTITKEETTETVWVDGPSYLREGVVRNYYADGFTFTVSPDGDAKLKLIVKHTDGSYTATLDRYSCEGN